MDGGALYAWTQAERPGLCARTGFVTGDPLGAAGRALAGAGRPVLEKPFLPEEARRLARRGRLSAGRPAASAALRRPAVRGEAVAIAAPGRAASPSGRMAGERRRGLSMLTIRLLGEMAVLRGDEPLALPPSKKTRALLGYLVATGRAQRRDRLCSLLWEVPDDPRGALRWSLSKLRALVDGPGGTARILADRETVAFAAEGVACDLRALRDLAGARSVAHAETARLRAVAEGIAGDFLEGLDLPAQPEFQAWCVAEREDARRMHASLLRALVERLAASAPEEALPHARRLVGLDGFDAPARAALVGLLALLGRREEAEQHREAGLRQLREAGLPAGQLAEAARALRAPGGRGAAAPSASAPPAEPPPHAPDAAPRIVIVDDEAELGQIVTEYLARQGFAARAATSSAGLDSLLAAEPADLVILDVNLPGENGFDIARRLREAGGPPVLFLTASGAVVDRVAGLELGAEDYLGKPFDLRELRARLRVALRRSASAPQPASAAPAAAAPAPQAIAAPPPAPGPAERKLVTVLAVQLDEPAETDDPEAAAVQLDLALQAVRDAVAPRGGVVTAARPDGATAVFGAPLAQEDDAVSACLAALVLQDAARSSAWPAGTGCRIGLHSGEVVVRRGRDGAQPVEVVGPAVQLAGRAAAAAPERGIAVTDTTARRAEGFVTLIPLLGAEAGVGSGRLSLLTGRAPPRSRWDVRAARGLTRFLGRDAELEALRRALARAEAGAAGVVAIGGEPGIGKSRLVHEMLDTLVPPGWAVLATGAMPQDAGTPYLPLGTLLRVWLGTGERETAAAMAATLNDRIATQHPALAPHRAALASLLDLPVEDPAWRTLSPGLRRRASEAALRAVLSQASERQPLLVLFEDLHWADAPTVAALDALVAGLGAQRLLLVVTHRPEHRPGWAGRGGVSQLRLEALPEDATGALLRALVGDHPGLAALRREVAGRAEGVPLFLEEAVRALAEAGALAGTPGDYRPGTASGAALELPSSVQAVLAARIDRLPPRAKALLQTASVIGREVPLALLERVAGLEAEALHDTLDGLRAAEFLFETRLPPDAEYAFKHAMTQEAAYGGVLRERRRALHVAILRALEDLHRGRLEEQLGRLAHHALAGELCAEAVRYLLLAAQRAIERSAHAQAVELLHRGLKVLRSLPDTADRQRTELGYHKALGVALMALRGWGAQEVSDTYIRARELCEALRDERELFVALRGQGQFHMIRGDLPIARALGERCTELAACSHDHGAVLEAHHLFWSNSFFMGDYADAEEHARHGMAMYERERDHRLTYLYSGHDPGVCCRCFSGLMLWQRGQADAALARCREALALADRIGHPLTLALAQWAMSYVHLFRREPGEARLWAEREIAVCEEYQLPLLLSQGAFQLGWALTELGDPEAGIARMQVGLAGVSATGAEMGLPYFVALLGEAHARARRLGEGLAQVDRALVTAERRGARFQVPEILRLKGELLRRQPDEAGAEACFRQALAAARAQGARLPELRALTSLARLLRDGAEGAAVRDALAVAHRRFTEGFGTADLQDPQGLLRAGRPTAGQGAGLPERAGPSA
jgi:DNA-binding response OmpR family regulator/DNA-binding SARP family transcriptional activator